MTQSHRLPATTTPVASTWMSLFKMMLPRRLQSDGTPQTQEPDRLGEGQRPVVTMFSHQGQRKEQQDRAGLFVSPDGEGLLAVVADGLGGHGDGAVGAQAVLDAAAQFVHDDCRKLRRDAPTTLERFCQTAHYAINRSSVAAHSTVVALWLYRGWATWVHVGDSRLYHLRSGQRLWRTRDHSATQLLFESGDITEAEMATHPFQNRLYRSLGGPELAVPETGMGQVRPGDVFVLCSDGVWEYVSDAEFWATANASDPQAATRRLVETAVQRGDRRADNATLVMFRAPWHAAAWRF